MNCRLILLILIGYLPFTAFGQWNEAGRLPVGHVRSLFETETRLYAASEESFFRSTNANADSWEKIELPKPFTINFIYEYELKLLIGTDRHGIYEYNPNVQDPNQAWKNITDKVFENEKLEGENLSVNAIAAVGDIILANVYHEGNPSHGGSHSRIYLSPDGGDTWKQAGQFDPHNFVFSFTIDNTKSRIIASTLSGILTAPVGTELIWTTRSPLVAKKIISLGGTEFIGLPNNNGSGVLYRSIDNGTTWSQIAISDPRVKTSITDIAWGSHDNKFYLYASTYDGIFKITREDLVMAKTWENEYQESAFISNIRTRSINKFATAETGVLRRLSGVNTPWTKAESGLKINYVYATHANNKYVLAVTDNGLFRSPVDLTTKQFNWQQVARDILGDGSSVNRFLETRRAAIATTQTDAASQEIFVATNNGTIHSKDGGETWAKSVLLPVVKSPFDNTKFIYYQENIQSLMFSGNNLFAVAYETPFILENKAGAWKQLTTGLPFTEGRPPSKEIFYNGIIKGMGEISGEVYIYWEDYTSSAGRGGHDIWTFPDTGKSGVYKLNTATKAWELIKALDKRAKIHGFVAYGENLIFSAQNIDDTYTFHSLPVKTLELQQLNNPITEDEVFIKEIYHSDGNLFMTNTDNKTILVSADGGKVWKSIEDAPSTVSSLTVNNNLVYAGITGNGMWYKSFHEFFPVIITEPKPVTLVEAVQKVTESNRDTVSIVLNQFIPGSSVKLHTRSLTRENWKEWPVTSDSKSPEKFSLKLPIEQFDEVGLAYFWSVTPPKAYQNPANPTVKSNTVKVAILYTKGLPVPEKLNVNKNPKKAKYQMISFPLLSDNNTIGTVLGDELKVGEDDPGLWRLTYYNGKNQNGWPDTDQNDLLNIGQGYWLAATSKGTKSEQITVSPGRTVANDLKTDPDGNFYYEVTLKANDWTQIGNPLLLHIDWKDVQNYPLNSGLNVKDLVTYSNSTRRKDGGILGTFSGGYLKNETEQTILRIPVKRNVDLNGPRISAEEELLKDAILAVNFSIQSEEMTCQLSGLGIHAEAQAGLDKFDLVVPPSPGGFPTMRFITEAEKQAITRSILPPQAESQEWEFTINQIEEDEKATLTWKGLKIEEGKALWLHDLQSERKIDMRSVSSYQFKGLRRFRVYYGSEHFLKERIMPEKSLLSVFPNPLSESAKINFTLPKNSEKSEVKLALLDAKGAYLQLIHESTYQPGFHEITWNGADFVQNLPQGLYMVELQINNGHGTKTYYQKVIKR